MHRNAQILRLADEVVESGLTYASPVIDVRRFDSLRINLAIVQSGGAGAGRVDVAWLDDDGATVFTTSNAGAAAEVTVKAPKCQVKVIETEAGEGDEITISGIVLGAGAVGLDELPGGIR